MTILEQILAGLQQKFAGVDTAILTRIATKKADLFSVLPSYKAGLFHKKLPDPFF